MYILLPDHSAAIAGVSELLQAFSELNRFSPLTYSLSSLKSSLMTGNSAWLKNQTGDRDIALFFVPTTVPIDGALLDFCGGTVRAFATPSTGTDHVDLSLLESRGIPFFSGPGENATAVVEYVLSALPLFFDPVRLLSGDLSLGIVGSGRIGGLLGRACQRLGYRVSAFDPFVLGSNKEDRVRALKSDVVTFHLPLTREGPHPTAGMIDERWIEGSHPGSVWMNTGRGQIFDPGLPELFLESLSRFRTLYDVFPVEPPSGEWIQKATLATPHVAGYTWRGRFMGVFHVFSDFALASGLSMPFQPADFRPAEFELKGPSFLLLESGALKAEPGSFSKRRNAYPSRSSFRDDREMGREYGTEGDASAYFHRLYQLWDEMRL